MERFRVRDWTVAVLCCLAFVVPLLPTGAAAASPGDLQKIASSAGSEMDDVVTALSDAASWTTSDGEVAALANAAQSDVDRIRSTALASIDAAVDADNRKPIENAAKKAKTAVERRYDGASQQIAAIVAEGAPPTSTTTTTTTIAAPGGAAAGGDDKPGKSPKGQGPNDGNGIAGDGGGTDPKASILAETTVAPVNWTRTASRASSPASSMPTTANSLAHQISVVVPPQVVTAVLSPVIVAEILLRTIFESAQSLLLPTVLLMVGLVVMLLFDRRERLRTD